MSGTWLPPEPKPHTCKRPEGADLIMRPDGARWQCNDCGAIYTLGSDSEHGDTWRTWTLTTKAPRPRPEDPGRIRDGW